MQVEEVLARARDSITVARVFGDPIERDGVTVIPVAKVMGGAGGGSGEGPVSDAGATSSAAAGGAGAAGAGAGTLRAGSMGSGSGAGFGVRATPAGVYVIKDGSVQWVPAIDVTRIALMGQVVAILLLLVVRSIARSRAQG
jgi:uncharacterized spore protein YtfJ